MKFASLIFTLSLLACNPQPIGNQKAIKEEIENREIKRVTKSEILEAASRNGEIITDVAQKTLAETLMEKIGNEGVIAAIDHCNVVATPLLDSLSDVYGAEIRRVSSRLRNTSNKPDEIEAEILDAYQYAWENGLQSEPNVQEDEEVILYTKPIMLSNPICLNCHGQVRTNILEETLKTLDSLYPTDSAKGYNLGDLRGMWSIRFLKKELIKKL